MPDETADTEVAIEATPAEMAHLLESAWGVIANAGWDGLAKTEGWQDAAVRWRDGYHRLLGGSPLPALEEPPVPPLPPGQFVRVELPGYRQHTGWVTEETRAGAGVLVIRDWNGAVQAEVFPGAGCQVVHLPTPLKRPEASPQLAISGRDFIGDDLDDYPDRTF